MTTDDQEKTEVCAWLVVEKEGDYRVIDWWGQPGTWSREDVRVHPDSLADFAKRILKIRERFNASHDCSEKMELRKQVGVQSSAMSSHSTWDGSIPEVLAAAWSLERGDRKTAAQLMIPLMKEVSNDKQLLDNLRDEIAVKIDSRMLTAFTVTRDYDEALRFAKILSSSWFDGFRHQDRAKGLLATLPRRTEDFKTLRLMSTQDWERSREKHSRKQQIGHLAKRLRLIHATQWGIPGEISYSSTQYLCDKGPEDKKEANQPVVSFDGKEAINPYCELLRMNLTGAEMLQLLPYLESEHYILAYDLYRFIPNNPLRLHKVSWTVASILNTVSQEDLVDFSVLQDSSQDSHKRHFEQVRKWCTENADTTHADCLAEAVVNAAEWQDARWAFWGLLELEEERAVKLIVSRCDKEPNRAAELAQLLCLLDRKEYLLRARQWLKGTNSDARFWAALLLLKHTDPKKAEGIDTVLDRLIDEIEGRVENGKDSVFAPEPSDLLDAAIEPLLAIDDPRVHKFFATYCGENPYRDFEPSAESLQRLFLSGHEAALQRLLQKLDDRRPAYEGSKRPRSDSWIWWLSLWRYENPPDYLYDVPDERREELDADLRRWLRKQFQLIGEGKPSLIIKEDRRLPWGEWKVYSTGWVRRI